MPSLRLSARLAVIALLACAIVPPAPVLAAEGPAGPYLGQTPPGMTAEVFAPGVVSVTGRYEYGLAVSPDGGRILFTAQTADDAVRVMQARLVDGAWTGPAPLSLAGGARKDEMEAFFSPDGRRVYFAPYDEGMDVRIWSVEVDGDAWRDPAPLAGSIADQPAFYPTCAADGTLYYTDIAERRPYRARRGDDGDWAAEPLAVDYGGHCFPAPDQSFVLLDARDEDGFGKGDIHVAFADGAGGWSRPVNLGIGVNTAYSESCPSLSADGGILFFSRYDEEDERSQIYWVDAAVVERARPAPDADDRAVIARIVYDSLAWAVAKDRARLEGIIAHDDDYFAFHPDGLEAVHGYEAFQAGFALWLDPRFKAFPPDIRDYRCHLSRSGDVAWFSAIVDDCYTWDGQPGCWKDTRWTGVLEKRDAGWAIMQMHFSFAADRVAAEALAAEARAAE